MNHLADIRAEQAVLAACLMNADAIWRVRPIVAPEDFYDRKNELLFGAMNWLAEEGKPIEPVTLMDTLTRDDHLDDIGCASYITEVLDATQTSANADVYARQVQNASQCRQLLAVHIKLGAKLKTGLQDAQELGGSVAGWIQEATQGATKQAIVTPRDCEDKHKEWLHGDNSAGAAGLRLGIPELDSAIGHGIDNELVVIAARPSVGKTTLMLNIAHYLATNAAPGLVVTLETETHKLLRRLQNIVCPDHLFSRAVGVGGSTLEKWDLRRKYEDTFYDLPLWFHDRERQVEKVYYLVKQALCLHPEIQWVAIDYLQLFDTEKPLQREYDILNHALGRICALKKDIDRTIFVFSQLRRFDAGEKPRPPRLSDLRGTGRIEQDADIVIMLHDPKDDERTDSADPVGNVQVMLEKNRDGGRYTVCELEFRKEQTVICSPGGRQWMTQTTGSN